MRVLLPVFILAQASIATSCAHIYDCGHGPGDAVRVDVRGRTDGNYNLEIMNVDGPGHGGMCSAPAYAIGEDATLIEMGGGEYTLLAKAEDAATPYAFPLRGEVSVEPGRCYVPAMSCDAGAHPDASTCRLVLKPSSCAWHLLPRRVRLIGESGC